MEMVVTKVVLSRKERERLRHKEEILAVALGLFAQKGFHNVSMQEIAAESEFSVGTLYNFFAGKESLFAALMTSSARQISAILLPILDEDVDEKSKIANFISAHSQIIRDHAPAIRLYLSHAGVSTLTLQSDITPETEALQRGVLEKLCAIIKSGIVKGQFKDIDPGLAALSLSSMLESYVFSAVDDSKQDIPGDGLSVIEEIFFGGALR